MKKVKRHKKIIVLLIICLIISIIIFEKNYKNKSSNNATSQTTLVETSVSTQTIEKTLTGSGEITTAQTENLALNTYKYFSSMCVEEDDAVAEGQNILQYTDGTYLTAPYNCIVSSYNVPTTGSICTNSNQVTIQNTKLLSMSVSVNESEISKLAVGQEAIITIPSLEDKEYIGTVTNISNTATYSSNGSKFSVTVEFDNDEQILVGMTGKTEIILEKTENAVVVPIEAIITQNKRKYITIIKENGEKENVEVETGISNDAFIEIIEGIESGTKIEIIKNENNQNNKI